MILTSPPVDIEKDACKLEAERRLREISKHREMGDEDVLVVHTNLHRCLEVHTNLHRCLEELRSGFQDKAHHRRNNLVRRNAVDQARRKQFDQLRDLQRVEEDVRTSPKGPNPLRRHRRLVSSVDEGERQLHRAPTHRRIVSS